MEQSFANESEGYTYEHDLLAGSLNPDVIPKTDLFPFPKDMLHLGFASVTNMFG